MADGVLFGEDELPPAPSKLVTDAVEEWNRHAKDIPNWPAVTILDYTRMNRVKKAVQTSGGLAKWRLMLKEAAQSDILTARASWAKGSKWFNFDWLIKPANIVKVLEGNYKNGEEQPQTFADKMRGVGVKASYAEPAKPFVRTETLEQRLAASIISYRKYGKWAEANRVETKLAGIEGRAPVHVPSPDTAHIGMPERPAEIPRRPSRPVTDLVDEYELEPMGDDFGGDE